MTTIDPNILITSCTAIAATIVGALASIIPGWAIEKKKHDREAKSIEASLLAEIRALLEVADEREYMKSIDLACAYLETQPKGTKWSLTVRIPDTYSRVYQTHAHKIGIINPEIAVDVLRFHQLIDAVVQDVRPEGTLSQGATVEAFQQSLIILKKAFDVGRQLCP